MSKPKAFSCISAPLTPAVFYILLSLAGQKRHGYAIMKQVAADSQNRVRLGPGTLYGAIKRLVEAGLIVEIASSSDRRRYYQLTSAGRSLFSGELDRLDRAVQLAHRRLVAHLAYV